MSKLIVTVAFAVAFGAFVAIRFIIHHTKIGIREAKKAADAINIAAISTAIDDDQLDTSSQDTIEKGTSFGK